MRANSRHYTFGDFEKHLTNEANKKVRPLEEVVKSYFFKSSNNGIFEISHVLPNGSLISSNSRGLEIPKGVLNFLPEKNFNRYSFNEIKEAHEKYLLELD